MNHIPLNVSTFDNKEIDAAIDTLRSTYLTMGPKCAEFEQAFARTLNVPEAIFVNSGSSANLLMFFALANHAVRRTDRKRFVPGCEVIVPAVTWSTTIWPIVQAGAVPVLVDCDPRTLQCKPESVRAALTERTVAVCVVHVLGNTVALDEIAQICRDNGLWLLEDVCEALGSRYSGKLTGTFGDMATFSFFFSHHISTIEGGMVVTGDEELGELLRCLRAHGWTRQLRRRQQVEAMYPGVDPRFLFINTGFNVRPTELNAAIGLVQLEKLSAFNKRRNEIAVCWTSHFDSLISAGLFEPMRPTPGAEVASFGYPVVCRDSHTRDTLRTVLDKSSIENRPIICGNMARQPAMAHVTHRVAGELSGADQIMDCGLFWGTHPMMTERDIAYVADAVSGLGNLV